MADQAELECVSCETTFDPNPTGGFCPDCDTPHPDFGIDDDGTPDESSGADDTSEDQSSESVDDSMSYCPECGADLSEGHGSDADGSYELEACPDCGHSVTDESYCPNCGSDLDAARADSDEETADESDAADDSVGDDADAADEAEPTVTLVIDGNSYTFGDGDTFGRQDEEWLESLVSEAGGSDDVAFISSDHLEFSADNDGVYVADTSRNGTKLNGTELDGDEKELEDGDTLELAERAELTVKL